MTYTVSSGMLNSSIPYHTILTQPFQPTIFSILVFAEACFVTKFHIIIFFKAGLAIFCHAWLKRCSGRKRFLPVFDIVVYIKILVMFVWKYTLE